MYCLQLQQYYGCFYSLNSNTLYFSFVSFLRIRIFPTRLQENNRDGLGEFSNTSKSVFGAGSMRENLDRYKACQTGFRPVSLRCTLDTTA